MPNSQLVGATHQFAGACGCSRSLQLWSRSPFVLRAQDAARPSISAPRQAAERKHTSAPSSTGLEVSTRHSNSDSTFCRHGPQLSSSQGATWQVEQAEDRSVRKQSNEREAAQAGLRLWWHRWLLSSGQQLPCSPPCLQVCPLIIKELTVSSAASAMHVRRSCLLHSPRERPCKPISS